jgi:hypothetical protein
MAPVGEGPEAQLHPWLGGDDVAYNASVEHLVCGMFYDKLHRRKCIS